jgi:hypothetical protein
MSGKVDDDAELERLARRLAGLFGGDTVQSRERFVGLDGFDDTLLPDTELSATQRRQLEARFHAQMIWLFREVRKQTGYVAARFLAMIADIGGVATAKKLLHAAGPSDGFLFLLEAGRLDLTVENFVLDSRFAPLFTEDELARAESRLHQFLR